MITELFTMVTSNLATDMCSGDVRVNLNRNRVKSISSFSSNSIFYFPTIVSDQLTPEEVAMVARMVERSYSSFVIACISLMPFHRVSSGDIASVESYLSQLHQNMGIGKSTVDSHKAMNLLMSMGESATSIEDKAKVDDFLFECWNTAKATQEDFVKVVANEVPLYEMYNESSTDPVITAMRERYQTAHSELNEWGYIGQIDESAFATADLAYEYMLMDEAAEDGAFKRAMNAISPESIKRCNSVSKLKGMQSKLKSIKSNQIRILNRFKTKEKNEKLKEKVGKGKGKKHSVKIGNKKATSPKDAVSTVNTNVSHVNKRIAAIDSQIAKVNKGEVSEPDTTKPESMDESFGIPAMVDLALLEAYNESEANVHMADEVLFEAITELEYDDFEPMTEAIVPNIDGSRPQNNINPYTAANTENPPTQTFGKEVFTNMEMKKANDAIPTFARASIGFVIDETEEVITRDVVIGIKAYIHKVPAKEIMDDIYNCIIRKRKFLKFVKYITGEERSLADLLFCVKNLKDDAVGSRGERNEWRAAIKRRKRWSQMSVPYITKEYTPNATLVITRNEVEFLKEEYGIDMTMPAHINAVMETNFLLGLVIVDQGREIVYVTYDGFGGKMQEYTYSMLERETAQSDRMMRELYRSFSR